MSDSKPAHDKLAQREQYFQDTMYGTYSDVLFILFPFLVIFLLRIWNDNSVEIFTQPELSIAAAILAGLSMGKFVLGLIGDHDLGRYKERIVFFMAINLFLVLGPSLMIIVKLVNDNEAAKFVAYVQPILLTIAIALYSVSVSVHKIVEQRVRTYLNRDTDDILGKDMPTPLVIDPNAAYQSESESESDSVVDEPAKASTSPN